MPSLWPGGLSTLLGNKVPFARRCMFKRPLDGASLESGLPVPWADAEPLD